jgi:hypothetical protein
MAADPKFGLLTAEWEGMSVRLMAAVDNSVIEVPARLCVSRTR